MDWNGRTTLGDGWALYEGPTATSRPHCHLAVQLAIGLEGPVAITGDHGTITGAAVLVQAGVRHRLAPVAGGVRCVFVEVDSRAGRAWTGFDDDIMQAPADLAREFETTVHTGATLVRLEAHSPARPMDERLIRALAALADNPGGAGAIARAAAKAKVSVSSLRALAAEALTAPLAQWRQWRMLAKAAGVIAAGQSLADAAAEAGFSDQAHLTRTMGRFFGITPGVAATSLRRGYGWRAE